MRPFNIEEAKEGKPVCTRDGRPVRILCLDVAGELIYKIVALVMESGTEYLHRYMENGRYNNNKENKSDLMMAPEKKEGWINIYHAPSFHYPGDHVYDSKKKAFEMREIYSSYVNTIKIEWEE